jgi:uncharacterized protein (TIGR02147 family)
VAQSKNKIFIEDFYNYREYLKNYLVTAKIKNPKFSIGAWSKKLGLKSTAALAKILSGERGLGDSVLEKLIIYFQFTKQETLTFRSLVSISKMKISEQDKAALCQKLYSQSKNRKLESRRIALDQFNLFATNLPFAIYELGKIPGLTVKKLMSKLSDSKESDILESIKTLTRLNFIDISSEQTIRSKKLHLETTDDVPNEAIKHYHKNGLTHAAKKIDDVAVELREFQSLLLLLNTKNLAKYKKMVRDLMDDIENCDSSDSVNRLYALQVQLYPVSAEFEESKL